MAINLCTHGYNTHILKDKRDKQATGKENVEEESTVDNLQMEVDWREGVWGEKQNIVNYFVFCKCNVMNVNYIVINCSLFCYSLSYYLYFGCSNFSYTFFHENLLIFITKPPFI